MGGRRADGVSYRAAVLAEIEMSDDSARQSRETHLGVSSRKC
jgi:hypothetical protein